MAVHGLGGSLLLTWSHRSISATSFRGWPFTPPRSGLREFPGGDPDPKCVRHKVEGRPVAVSMAPHTSNEDV